MKKRTKMKDCCQRKLHARHHPLCVFGSDKNSTKIGEIYGLNVRVSKPESSFMFNKNVAEAVKKLEKEGVQVPSLVLGKVDYVSPSEFRKAAKAYFNQASFLLKWLSCASLFIVVGIIMIIIRL